MTHALRRLEPDLELTRFGGHPTVRALEPRNRESTCRTQSRPYPPEFRAEAVRLARQRGPVDPPGRALTSGSRALGAGFSQTTSDHVKPPGLTSDERAELVRLRREKTGPCGPTGRPEESRGLLRHENEPSP